jgi:hypothetical protein
MERDTSTPTTQEPSKTTPNPKDPTQESPKPSISQNVEFWIIDRKILTLNLLECESLWELKTGLLLHPLVMLFSNFELFFNGKNIGEMVSLTEYITKETQGKDNGPFKVELVPGNLNIQEARQALLALVKLIQDPTTFLSNQMMKFHEIIGRQEFLGSTLSSLEFDCEDVGIENVLGNNLNVAQQFLKLHQNNENNLLKLDNLPEEKVRELQFLRQLVLPVNPQVNLQGFEEYFEVLVETIERTYLGFVFSKRGIYLSRRQKNEDMSLQLLSLPRDNRKRMSGFYPSMIPLLVQESPAFAQRFQEMMQKDLTRVENDGLFLLLNCSLSDVRFQYKHWIKQKSLSMNTLLGEGRW